MIHNKVHLVYKLSSRSLQISIQQSISILQSHLTLMESWRELFDIFLNSPTPKTDASLWLQSHQSSTTATSLPPSTPITTISFLSLLSNPIPTITDRKRCVMWIQTLPDFVQARVLSFLAMDYRRFDARELRKLAGSVLAGGNEVDFWVERGARQLLDVLSDRECDWVSGVRLHSDEKGGSDEVGFDDIPVWIKDACAGRGSLLPWLPVLGSELSLERLNFAASGEDDESVLMEEVGGNDEVENAMVVETDDRRSSYCLKPEVCEVAEMLKTQLLCFQSMSKTINLAAEIRYLCADEEQDSLMVLGMIEPWRADDQTAAILISQLTKTDDKELGWPSQVLCSIILPKLLVLEEPVSRVLMAAAIEYCKQYQRAAVHALLFPLFFKKEGINRHLCDMITKLITECLHPAHASVFFQRLLTADKNERKFLTLPCHQHHLSKTVVWTESTFSVFQIALDHNILLTQDSVDHLVHRVLDMAETHPKSLKFGTFLLHLVTKCRPMLIPHKPFLSEAVSGTRTVLTKSVLAKLASL